MLLKCLYVANVCDIGRRNVHSLSLWLPDLHRALTRDAPFAISSANTEQLPGDLAQIALHHHNRLNAEPSLSVLHVFHTIHSLRSLQ